MSNKKKPVYLSANSRKLQSFRIIQKLGIAPVLMLTLVAVGLIFWVQQSYQSIMGADDHQENDLPADSIHYDSADIRNDNSPPDILPPTSPGSSYTPPTASTGGMPDNVSIIIDSIERYGIKDNPHVSADTSSIPDGTTVSIDRGSWVQQSGDMGYATGTINAYGQSTGATLSFQNTNGSWEVTGYALDM